MNKYNYEMTNYPNIYKKSYWGNKIDNINSIIYNRNKFIEEFNIIKKIRFSPKYINKEFEILEKYNHKECYLTNDKCYILVSSLYDKNDHNYNELDWKKYNNLYDVDTITYIKKIRMKYFLL